MKIMTLLPFTSCARAAAAAAAAATVTHSTQRTHSHESAPQVHVSTATGKRTRGHHTQATPRRAYSNITPPAACAHLVNLRERRRLHLRLAPRPARPLRLGQEV